MTQEEKELLLKDLCARLQDKVMIYLHTSSEITGSAIVLNSAIYGFIEDVLNNSPYEIKEIKPYLRPMSRMTKEEEIELYQIAGFYYLSNNELLKDEWRQFSGALSENKLFLPYPIWGDDLDKVYDWLNAHHFDYRGLIEKDLALEASEDIYINNEIQN